MVFYVYVLFSLVDKHFYIGYTNDLKRRLRQHLSGKTKSLKYRKDLKLIYFEGFFK